MAVLLDFVRNSIWHAFSTLTDQERISVPKSKLKVLVTSLGTILDCHGLSSALDDFGSFQVLNFFEFETYLTKEVFTSLSDSLNRKELALLESEIDEACWIICKSQLIVESIKRSPRLDSESIYKLFRIYCLLADLIREPDNVNAQVLLCSEEADLVFNKFLTSLNKEWNVKDDFECLFSNALFDFQTFLSVIELKFLKYFEKDEVVDVINELYDEFVDDIIKKGTLLKRGEYFSKYVEKLFVLRSSGLTYYTNPKKPKVIEFDSQTRVEEVNEQSHSKLHFFTVITNDRVLQLATMEKRYRSQWLSSIRMTLSRLHCQDSYGRFLKNKRRLEWHRIRIRRQFENDRTKEMLEIEKLARQAAEDQAKELTVQKAIEEGHRRNLEEMRIQLEKLLAEEIQAKHDEELVRSLQARILNEEWEKREELEKLQDEQRKLLDVERHKSKTYLLKQHELEKQLEGKQEEPEDSIPNQAQGKLRELERARGEMDTELRSSRLKNAERNREILETRLRLFSAPIVEDENIRRARRSVSMREGRQITPLRPSNLPRIEFDHS